ncbi:FAD/NAD(P)-binding domain-containing protein [Rhizodiscina lignyota]|uniref:FAD/NAD(P)-binding domain-containing protein n=1 Tax=Rhizodiscina lignyota TaxID=1504668 RepID=A0A9P4M312_9PEZI|nr:FAD/NAD(P)-binding domain-containing protein [Rhizodiscina lignyota]
MSRKPLSILISGQGIAGSSLALMLARHPSFSPKPNITLVERSSTPRTTGQAIDIRGPAIPVIRLLGLEEKIKQRHTSETGIAFVGANGEPFAQFDMTSNNKSPTSEFEILRGELASLLLEEVEVAKETEGANVHIVYGESIESLEESDDGVQVKFANGKLTTQKFDAVVAADGMSSKTRSMIFGEDASQESIKPMGQYIAFFTAPRVEGDTDIWRWYVAPGGIGIHIRPHRNKTTMGIYLTVTNSKRERMPELDEALLKGVPAQKAYMRAKFAGAGFQSERALDAMDLADDFYMQQTAQVRTPKWSKGRCVLVGDSAYCIMGMGTSLAMIGAYLVAGELSKVASSKQGDIAAALTRHEEILRPLVSKHEKMPPGFPQMASPQTRFGIGILRTTMRVVTFVGFHRFAQLLGEGTDDEWKLPDYGW